ncbi:hypothetical protein AL046_07880 [Pseudomonas syringae pv. avii]|nr:hypothetical protein AL046_07880 [Pseudomonas syringae pv. avii]
MTAVMANPPGPSLIETLTQEASGNLSFSGSQLTLRTTKLLKQQVGESWIWTGYTDGILKSFVMNEHVVSSGFVSWEASTHTNGLDSTQSLAMREQRCERAGNFSSTG